MAKNIMTPEARLSFPALLEPKEDLNGNMKYSASLIFQKDADLSELKAAAIAVAEEKWGAKAKGMLEREQIRMPFRDGAKRDTQGYGEGTIFINTTSKQAPGVVDRALRKITDPDEVYPGCYVRMTLRPFAYETSGNRGVSFGMQNVQKLRDGDRLDGRKAAEQEFDELPPLPGADAELSDIIG